MNKTKDTLPFYYKLSPDFFSRYFIITKIVSSLYGKRPVKLLELGGKGTIVNEIITFEKLPYELKVTDILPADETTIHIDYEQVDATKTSFKDQSFDVVYSTDVLEHIPDELKETFVLESLRLAKDVVIIAAPFHTVETDTAEHVANDMFKDITGRDHPWLLEHFEQKKPSQVWLETLLKEKKLEYRVIQSNNLENWIFTLMINFLSEKMTLDIDKIHESNIFYNTNITEVNDFSEPAYRQIYIVFKNRTLVTNFTDLFDIRQNYKKIFQYKKMISEFLGSSQDFLQEENRKLRKRAKELQDKNTYLTHDLSVITNSKTFKTWQFYAKGRKGIKALKKIRKLHVKKALIQAHRFTHLVTHDRFLLRLRAEYELAKLKTYRINRISLKVLPDVTNKKVVILIPWYGDENIFELIPNIFETDPDHVYKLIIVNDAYPDKVLGDKLAAFINQQYKDRVQLIKREENGGFVKAVNSGLKQIKRDVIVLNSDVKTTPNWIKKILEVAYYSETIATVTPMSNNATIFSVPRMNYPNVDNDPYHTASILERVTTVNVREVPTCHGFCMFIKYQYLKQYGLLDEKTYNKGFGEENDMSMWFRAHGLNNVAATGSYVMHLESRSFGHKKRLEYIAQNYKKLIARYPEYHELVHGFISENPFSDIQNLVSFFKEQPMILQKEYTLIVLHKNPITVIGGVEKETLALIRKLYTKDRKRNFLIYYFEEATQELSLMICNGLHIKKIIRFNDGIKNSKILKWIIQAFTVNAAVVEHLDKHSLEYAKILKEKQIKSILFIHDWYFFCQIPDLIDYTDKFCYYEKSISTCNNCLYQKLHNFTDQKVWREQAKDVLTNYFDTVIFNSEFTLNKYCELYKIPKRDAFVVSYPDIS